MCVLGRVCECVCVRVNVLGSACVGQCMRVLGSVCVGAAITKLRLHAYQSKRLI